MKVELDPAAAAQLDELYDRDPETAARIDECLDWVEAEPMDPRAYRRMFSGGVRAISRVIREEERLVLWEPDGDVAAIRVILPADQL